MWCFYLIIFLASLLPTSSWAIAPDVQEICPDRVVLIGKEKIKFNALEKVFLCGDPSTESWKTIPFNQVQFHISTFLEERGYHHPTFSEKGDILEVNPGEKSFLKKVTLQGAPDFLNIKKRRKILNHPLTPKLLNEIEEWVAAQLKNRGYACPAIESRANIETGIMEMKVDPGIARDVESVTQESVPGLGAGTLRRYDAFVMGKTFNESLLDLSAERVEKSGILQSNHFTWDCEALPSSPQIDLYQRTFAGKPRLVNFSFGADTQEYAIVKGAWKHTRLGSKASSFAVSLYASYRRQQLDFFSDLHIFSPLSRWYLKPLISFYHEKETDFQYLSGDARLSAVRNWDNQKVGFRSEIGPNLNYVYTFKGANPGLTRFFSLQYDFDLMSHLYEIWQTDPRTGYRLHFTADLNNKKILSQITAQRFSLEGKYYYNIKGLDPPLLVLGIRGGFYGTFLDSKDTETRDRLPPNYRFYLGGSQNLRGFGLTELPQGDGALSAAFTSVELRLAKTLPFWVEPLVFFDIGALGQQAGHFNLPLYFSPGGGVRVASPIGVFRVTVSKGLKTGNQDGVENTHFQFFASFGEEF